ncbi:MAG: hypothetical protein WDO73_02405 [Ignavibacteriota bacterium]
MRSLLEALPSRSLRHPAGGSGTQPYLFYTYNVSGVNQLGGILPSTLATGTYNVTVTYNSVASAPVSVDGCQGEPRHFSHKIPLAAGRPRCRASSRPTEYDLNRLTTGSLAGPPLTPFSPAKPGQTIIVWATGLGPVSGYADNIVPPQTYNYPNVQVIIGGTTLTPNLCRSFGIRWARSDRRHLAFEYRHRMRRAVANLGEWRFERRPRRCRLRPTRPHPLACSLG